MPELLYTPHYSPELEKYNEFGFEISKTLVSNVANHDDPHDGFSPQEYDIELYPYQRPDCIRVSGENAGSEVLRYIASQVYPNVEPIIESYKKRPDLLNHIYDKLNGGHDTGIITDHSSVIGVAIAGGALACALYEEDYMSPDDLRTGIFVSSMIKRSMLQGSMPTVDILASIFSETFFSLPPSESIRNLDIPKEYRTDFNTEIKADFDSLVNADGAMLLMLAGSGSRDKTGTLSLGRKRVFMGPLANGTVDILQKIYSLPVGIDIRGEKPHIFIDKLQQPVSSSEEAHLGMQKIANGMSKGLKTRRKYYRTREQYKEAWQRTVEYKKSLESSD